MRAKVISVLADEHFMTLREGAENREIPADERLEAKIQMFLDQTPKLTIRSVHFSTVPIVPSTGSWGTTNTPIEWIINLASCAQRVAIGLASSSASRAAMAITSYALPPTMTVFFFTLLADPPPCFYRFLL